MSKYKVVYTVDEDVKPHERYYNAKDDATAICMFNETCEESLCGSEVEVLSVVPLTRSSEDVES
jgi:hypothetical protein